MFSTKSLLIVISRNSILLLKFSFNRHCSDCDVSFIVCNAAV